VYVGVIAGAGHQTGLSQNLERIAQVCQPTSQAATGSIADSHVLDEFWRADTALVQVGNRVAVAV
jgi:hypothetical protein